MKTRKGLQHEVNAGKIAIYLTAPPPSSLAGDFGVQLPKWSTKVKLVEHFEKGFILNGIQYKPLNL